MMIRLIYASRCTTIGPGDVKDILASSRRNNQKLAVTGALCLSNGIFLQCLEGDRAVVNALYHRLLKDPRHTDPQILSFEEATKRLFSGWNMGLVASTNENAEIFLKYSTVPSFDPYQMSAQALQEFFAEMLATTRWLS